MATSCKCHEEEEEENDDEEEEECGLPFFGMFDNDEDGMIEALNSVTCDDDVLDYRRMIHDTANGDFTLTADASAAVKMGGELMAVGRVEEALNSFIAAVEAEPARYLNYATVTATCMTGLRVEEGLCYLLAGMRAAECHMDMDKAYQVQVGMLYARLGYITLARKKLDSAKLEQDENKKSSSKKPSKKPKNECEKYQQKREEMIKMIDEIARKTSQHKEMDAADFEQTIDRLFSSSEPAICAFLFHHLNEHPSKTDLKKGTFLKKLDRVLKNFHRIPALSSVLNKADFRRWSLAECSLLMEFFQLVNSCFTDEDEIYPLLFAQPNFRKFLANFAESLVHDDTLKFLAHCGTLLHFDIVTSWIGFLTPLTKANPKYPVQKDFFRQKPFDSLLWHARLLYSAVIGFFGIDSDALTAKRILEKNKKSYVEACSLLDHLLKESWFLAGVEALDEGTQCDCLGMLDLTVHLNFFSRQDLLLQPKIEDLVATCMARPDVGYSPKRTLVLYETLLTKCPTLLEHCRGHPGLFLHISERLVFLSESMPNFAGDGGPDLQITLNMLNLLLDAKDPVDIHEYVKDEEFVDSLTESLAVIMKTKIDQGTEMLDAIRSAVVKIIIGFSKISEEVVKALIASDDCNIFSAVLNLKTHNATTAHCFYILLKTANQSQLQRAAGHHKMNAFLAQLLMLIYEGASKPKEELAVVFLCLMRAISSTPTVVSRESLMEAVLFSYFEQPEKLVTKLCSLIRPPRRRANAQQKAGADPQKKPQEESPLLQLCAGMLLAALVKKDTIFRAALREENTYYGKISDDFRKVVANVETKIEILPKFDQLD